MKIFDTCIRAYIGGNLGDDLFIYTLCKRYPNTKFVMCGLKEYKKNFEGLSNLLYISADDFFIKWVFRCINLPAFLINKITAYFTNINFCKLYRCFEFLSRHSKHNILISGSIFMEIDEGKFIMQNYYKTEKDYFRLHPYVIGCNFGPYHNLEYLQFYQANFSKAQFVCFRDKYSASLFQGNNIYYAPDILFTYPKGQKCNLEKSGYILISIMNLLKDGYDSVDIMSNYKIEIKKFIRQMLTQNETVVLMGFCNSQGDHEVIDSIYNDFKDNEKVSYCNYPEICMEEAVNYIKNAKTIIATRYHAMILGWLFEKNVLPIVYSKKMMNVIDDLVQDYIYVELDELDQTDSVLYKKYELMQKQNKKIDIEKINSLANIHFQKLDELLKQ